MLQYAERYSVNTLKSEVRMANVHADMLHIGNCTVNYDAKIGSSVLVKIETNFKISKKLNQK